MRPYTPVGPGLTASSQDSDLFLMVKVYPEGMFSSYLSALPVGRSSQQGAPCRTDETSEPPKHPTVNGLQSHVGKMAFSANVNVQNSFSKLVG